MKKGSVVAIFIALMLVPNTVALQERKPLDVPFVPTKPEVVAEMLRMAEVGKDDILYDLGCGDGRIVITAAQLYGTRGVGVDIDPERIRESQENAAKAKVTHLVKFMEQDLFKTDIHEATVVSLYLLTSVNLRLRPKLFAELAPGTRIVSHNYGMDSWKPDQSSVVMVNEMTHNIYFWILPANISGTWEWSWPEGSKKGLYILEVDQHFQWPSGKIKVDGQELSLKEISIRGSKLQFTAEKIEGIKSTTMIFEGQAIGNTLKGRGEIQSGGKTIKKLWEAKRNPVTIKPLDASTWSE